MEALSAPRRVLENHDILLEIVEHLDVSSLYPFLLISKACAVAALPRLYRSFNIRPDVPSTTLELSPSDPKTDTSAAWSKRTAWGYVRTLNIPTHSTSKCPGHLPTLPNLKHIHLSEGGRSLDMGSECKTYECEILKHYTQAPITHLTIRRLHSFPPIRVDDLTLIIRPCQFPFDHRGEGPVSSATFSPLTGLRTIDIVVWDEAHNHRIDWIHHVGRTSGSYWAMPIGDGDDSHLSEEDAQSSLNGEGRVTFNPDGSEVPKTSKIKPNSPKWRRYKTKGCNYCDQSGCLRYTPNVPKQLAGMLYSVSRFTDVETIRVWNPMPSLRQFQWYDSKMTDEDCFELARSETERGRRERQIETQASNARDEDVNIEGTFTAHGARPREGGQNDTWPVPEFHTGQEWASQVAYEGLEDMTDDEESFWKVKAGEADESDKLGVEA